MTQDLIDYLICIFDKIDKSHHERKTLGNHCGVNPKCGFVCIKVMTVYYFATVLQSILPRLFHWVFFTA